MYGKWYIPWKVSTVEVAIKGENGYGYHSGDGTSIKAGVLNIVKSAIWRISNKPWNLYIKPLIVTFEFHQIKKNIHGIIDAILSDTGMYQSYCSFVLQLQNEKISTLIKHLNPKSIRDKTIIKATMSCIFSRLSI